MTTLSFLAGRGDPPSSPTLGANLCFAAALMNPSGHWMDGFPRGMLTLKRGTCWPAPDVVQEICSPWQRSSSCIWRGFMNLGSAWDNLKNPLLLSLFKEMPLRCEARVGGGWEELGITCDRVGCCESASKILHFHLSSWEKPNSQLAPDQSLMVPTSLVAPRAMQGWRMWSCLSGLVWPDWCS